MSRVSDLKSIDEWLAYYQAEGSRYLTQTPNLPATPALRKSALKSHLESHVSTAVSLRAASLRDGFTYGSVIRGTSVAGVVPFGKTLVKKGGSTLFLYQSLKAYGLDDRDRILELLWDGVVAAKLVETRPLKIFSSEAKSQLRSLVKQEAKDLWAKEGLGEAVKADLADELGDEVADEFIHVIPILGQAWSMGRGWYKAWKQLEKVLEVTGEKARAVHKDVLVFIVVEKLIPTERDVVKIASPSSSTTVRAGKALPSYSSTARAEKAVIPTPKKSQSPLPVVPKTNLSAARSQASTKPSSAPASSGLGEAIGTLLAHFFMGIILAALMIILGTIFQAFLYAVSAAILCLFVVLLGFSLVGVYAAFGAEGLLVVVIGIAVVGLTVYGRGRVAGARAKRKIER